MIVTAATMATTRPKDHNQHAEDDASDCPSAEPIFVAAVALLEPTLILINKHLIYAYFYVNVGAF